MHKKILVAALAMAGLVSTGAVYADDSGFMVRARAVSISWDNANKDNLLPAQVEAKDRWIPEVDISYFFTKNLATELVLTYPQTVDIKLGGSKIGNVHALPPSLLLQYHFTDLGAFKPYVGAGVNFTIFTDREVTSTPIEVNRTSAGLAAQVGFDYFLTKNVALNFDVKYIQMSTDVKVGGTKMDKVELNPVTAGVGVGYRF
ncbi:MAG: OmpW/AlkL family protein [Bacteroidota bacterium]